MSLLPCTTYANPDQAWWQLAGVVDERQIVAVGGNVGFDTLASIGPTILANVSFTAPEAGVIIANSFLNLRNTAATATQYDVTIFDSVGGSTIFNSTNLAAGNVTTQSGSIAPSMSIDVVQGQRVSLQLFIAPAIATPATATTYKWNWNVIFYPRG